MQASLPKMVRMISVDDIGQGSEALRILGVRWLPTGAAARSVSEDGKLKSNGQEKNDRSVSGQGEVESSNVKGDDGQDAQNNETMAQGMEAEEGDFVNVEIAFAYRPSTGRKRMKERAKNAHLYLAFYLPSNIKLRMSAEKTLCSCNLFLTLYSCLGRTPWYRWRNAPPSAAHPRSAILLPLYAHVLGTTSSQLILRSTTQANA